MEGEKTYHGKLMLFGEYSIMLGAQAMTIPLMHFAARWKFSENPSQMPENAAASNASLVSFYQYLSENNSLKDLFDLVRFKMDLDNGLYFDSNIPFAYGAGSSGALVAAVYESYAVKVENDTATLRTILALMESRFHGQSSGIDPISCLSGKPLLISNERIESINNPLALFQGAGSVFLIDTQTTAETGPLVEKFKNLLCHYSFYKKVRDTMLPETSLCIKAMRENDMEGFFASLRRLSAFQLEQMQPMIPEAFRDLWQKGLDSDDFLLKLCGSGGGGFLLGFSKGAVPDEIKDHYPVLTVS